MAQTIANPVALLEGKLQSVDNDSLRDLIYTVAFDLVSQKIGEVESELGIEDNDEEDAKWYDEDRDELVRETCLRLAKSFDEDKQEEKEQVVYYYEIFEDGDSVEYGNPTTDIVECQSEATERAKYFIYADGKASVRVEIYRQEETVKDGKIVESGEIEPEDSYDVYRPENC